jgi:hypothetical protein
MQNGYNHFTFFLNKEKHKIGIKPILSNDDTMFCENLFSQIERHWRGFVSVNQQIRFPKGNEENR